MSLSKNFKKITNLIRDFLGYFRRGLRQKQFRLYFNSFSQLVVHHLNRLRHSLYTNGIQLCDIHDPKLPALHRRVVGLHSLLPYNPLYSYSILLPLSNPNPHFLKATLDSLRQQTASKLEILIGFDKQPSQEILKIVEGFKKENPNNIKIYPFNPHVNKDHFVINDLASKATGHYLFLIGQEDWIRPDLLFRYEQTLRILQKPETTILYCDENQINHAGHFVPLSEWRKATHLHFPYFFEPIGEKSLLIPKALWQKVNGIKTHHRGYEIQDLLLQMEAIGAIFQHVPFSLYAARSKKDNKHNSYSSFIKVLQEYTKEKKLDWKWIPGYGQSRARAIPRLKPHKVQIVIPFKDQKELTLKCIHTVLKQKEVPFVITAIDNNSQDQSIAEELRLLGVEVLAINEPFNYSRLNNLAVKMTKSALDCDLVLFLNNDVELDSEALLEMVRWIDQPNIGMIGCRLHYPDGRLQHGGVKLDHSHLTEMRWEHIEKLRTFEQMDETKQLGVVEAVTAACALVKRSTFLAVGGFDEIWYPIGYSDTNLAVKMKDVGLVCFYTPYAFGIHHESVSRKEVLEDYENSKWLHNILKSQSKLK